MAKTYEEWEKEQLEYAKTDAEQYAQQRNERATASARAATDRYNALITQAEKDADRSVKEVDASYRGLYDANAVQELVARRQVEETLANMGLTDSGLNATQQTAISLQRGRNDHQTRADKQTAVNAIMRELDGMRAQYNYEASKETHSIYDEASKDILGYETNAKQDARQNAASLYATEQETAAAEDQQDNDTYQTRSNRENVITWAKKLWDSEAFGAKDSKEAQTGLAQYLYAQHAGNNVESGFVANDLYRMITGTQRESVLADGFISLLPTKEEYEATHGAGTFESYVNQELVTAVATGRLKETADIDAVIQYYGIVQYTGS